ncbi:DUF4234 domain-containing protein [Nocardioides mangrovicus]|uniref:DUF4234 domain-containing protein n=1 Tax=Nocardioides mangrovicus TaxID=2478913 RepID=A0A3L8P5C9_9ACTN|nr:DUF4234 domain-containing protein [Nocardioides mangrovicus]
MPQPQYTYDGPIGRPRSTGTCILLTVVTLGFYTWYWFYVVHDEMKRHTGNGIGGGLGLVLGILLAPVLYFLTPYEVEAMYQRKGWQSPVSALTGLWALLLGWACFAGLIVWFVQTNNAVNAYWRNLGAEG